MPANLSLILNLILLVAVVIAISRLIKTRRHDLVPNRYQPSFGVVNSQPTDEIIAVRKLTNEFEEEQYTPCEDERRDEAKTQNFSTDESQANVQPFQEKVSPCCAEGDSGLQIEPEKRSGVDEQKPADHMIMMFLLAKDKRQFAGYELLQTVLAAGLRFGEGDLFHRHQLPNGQGPVIFSLASATTSGTFDLQNMGAFNARGLCLFMQTSENATIDMDRFNILYETARQLSEGLDAHLLDEKRRPLTKEGLTRYQRVLCGGVESELTI
ncbi:MAG: cell division protein ZipA [Legionellales bacterium RIFCSPHIGHO2_12_FULL_42_9]|nr:MAG: cell division protein ZipA [Legionellales bacterium RIFCSPHIGHO2_12_FULL_42_9]